MPFKIGDVVSVYTDRSIDTKYKLIIVVAESKKNDNYLCAFINTDPASSPFIRNFHLPFVLNEERKFLEHDSFVDCYSPREFLSHEIQSSIDKNSKNHRGTVSDDDMIEIRSLIKENTQMTEGLRKSYF